MALTIKQLNGDSSFLLTFEPIEDGTSAHKPLHEPFTILLDPCISDVGTIHRSRTGSSLPLQTPCVSSLMDLPEPDLVVISRSDAGHCHEETLRQLPPDNTKTVILAEPAAAKTIRGWRHFAGHKVQTLRRWENPRQTGRDNVARFPVDAHSRGGGHPGEVTVSYVQQKRDLINSHSAIGISYRPPPSRPSLFLRPTLSPPATPRSPVAAFPPQLPPPVSVSAGEAPRPSSSRQPSPLLSQNNGLPTPPASPVMSRSVRSVKSTATLSPHVRDRALSVIFSPHGIPYSGGLEAFATTHLLNETALPLTALLHCFDDIAAPRWLGGGASTGAPEAQRTASTLGARALISAHDGRELIGGLLGKMARRRRYRQDEVRDMVLSAEEAAATATMTGKAASKKGLRQPIEVRALSAGEEVALTCEGVWSTTSESPVSATGKDSSSSLDGLALSEYWSR